MSKVKVSIIIPVYNAEKYLAACIDSCLNQAPYILGKDYEIICINDGSIDMSQNILESYSYYENGISVVSQQNSGVSTARNKGIDLARGEYIWFVDSDDIIHPNILSSLYEHMNKGSADGCSFRFKYVAETFVLSDKFKSSSLNEVVSPPNMQNAWVVIIKKEYLNQNKIRFNNMMCYGEDTLFVFYLRLYKHNFIYFDNDLYFYRQVSSSAMHQKNTSAQIKLFDSQMVMLSEYKYILDNYDSSLFQGDAKPQERYYWTVQNILFSNLKFSTHKRKDLFLQLKAAGHYPYPILWGRLFKNSKTLKALLINIYCIFFPIESYYRIIMHLHR